jgi:hypothetical protein
MVDSSLYGRFIVLGVRDSNSGCATDGVPDVLAVEVPQAGPPTAAGEPPGTDPQDGPREPQVGRGRIANELKVTLGVRVSPRTVRKYLDSDRPAAALCGKSHLGPLMRVVTVSSANWKEHTRTGNDYQLWSPRDCCGLTQHRTVGILAGPFTRSRATLFQADPVSGPYGVNHRRGEVVEQDLSISGDQDSHGIPGTLCFFYGTADKAPTGPPCNRFGKPRWTRADHWLPETRCKGPTGDSCQTQRCRHGGEPGSVADSRRRHQPIHGADAGEGSTRGGENRYPKERWLSRC